jgi:Tfp pilus assembly protein PilF
MRPWRTIAAGLLLSSLWLAGAARSAAGQEGTPVQQSLAAAREALRQQHYAEAIHLLQDALKRYPSDRRLQVELGRAYLYDRQDGRATQLFREVLREDPSNREAKLELARALGYQRDYKTSNQLYRELLAANPDDEAASIGLVRSLMHQKKIAEARREVEQALARHPNSLRLQEYRDRLEKGELGLDKEKPKTTPNRLQGDGNYFSDSAGNRSWRASQLFDYQIVPSLVNRLQVEERSLWVSGGPSANVFSGTDELRLRPRRWLLIGAGGGQVRFDDGTRRGLYRGEVMFHPARSLWLQGGFSRIPIYPTFQASQFDLLAEGWHTRLDWTPGLWRLNASWSRQHYSDSNRVQREGAELLRWIGSPGFALGAGYRFTHATFSQDLFHGYFSPSEYHSHLGLTGLRFGLGRVFRGEYLAGVGAESIAQGAYQSAWELALRNHASLRNWEFGVDYFYFNLAQSTGAFRAQVGRLMIAYRF